MQLEEAIAKEFADIIKEHLAAIDARLKVIEAREPEEIDAAPAEMIDPIAKAVALLAEAPPLSKSEPGGHPVVVNVAASGRKTKTITTRRDGNGNLVARVVEDTD